MSEDFERAYRRARIERERRRLDREFARNRLYRAIIFVFLLILIASAPYVLLAVTASKLYLLFMVPGILYGLYIIKVYGKGGLDENGDFI